MNIVVILGTTRINNQSRKVADFVYDILNVRHHAHVKLLDLSETDFPLMRMRYTEEESPSEMMDVWVECLKAASGIVIVSPEYKNGYPGSLKNFLDYLPPGMFRYKALGIVSVSSGSSGGSNCLSQLRLVSISMGGIVIPDRFQVSNVEKTFDLHHSQVPASVSQVAEKFVSEFYKYCEVLQPLSI